jgi:hypothetical protein
MLFERTDTKPARPRTTAARTPSSVCWPLHAACPACRTIDNRAVSLPNNTRRAPFLSACVGVVLVNNISARKKSHREVDGPAQRLQAAVEQLTGEHSTPNLDFFRAISAGECLVVSTRALCGAKLNSLTPLGSVREKYRLGRAMRKCSREAL